MKKLLMGAAAAALLAAPASAAIFVTAGTVNPIPTPGNNFKADLNNVGLFNFGIANAITVTFGRYKFEYLGSESGFSNTFQANGLNGSISFQETGNANLFAAPQNLGDLLLDDGTPDWSFLSNGAGAPFNTSSVAFSVFLPRGIAQGDVFKTNVLYLGFDDNTGNPDDNHDDILIRVSAVPEPATWAMMIAGFGLVGGAVRRRAKASPSVKVVYS